MGGHRGRPVLAGLGQAVHDRHISFEDQDGKTNYTARVLHWSAADREAHEKMGFHEGWSKATDQLAEVVAGR